MKGKVLILTGDGINCEQETARAFQRAGGFTHFVHVNELLKDPQALLSYSVFALPGGFSFGDELRSGKILAEKLRKNLLPSLNEFQRRGGMTFGICNGFQVLMQLGVFFEASIPSATLATNDHGNFLDFWTECELTKDAMLSPWFKGMAGTFSLPVRHKEGRVCVRESNRLHDLRIPIAYRTPINGSFKNAAAMMDQSGRTLGLMPHPEAALSGFLNPLNMSDEEKFSNAKNILQLFINAVETEVNQ